MAQSDGKFPLFIIQILWIIEYKLIRVVAGRFFIFEWVGFLEIDEVVGSEG